MNKKIYIIILNYNSWENTIECLESVLKNDYENYQIIVVDNNSPNNSMKYIKAWAEGKQGIVYDKNSPLKHLSQPFELKPLDYIYYTKEQALNGGDKKKELKQNNPIVFIQAGENGGFASGHNIGIKYALAKDDFEYVWLLNNDTVVASDTVSKFVKSFEEKKLKEKLGILGSIQYYYHMPDQIQAAAGGFNKWKGNFWNYQTLNFQDEDIAYIYGASMFIDKEVFTEVGLLNEEYFIYYEEIDLAERLKKYKFTQKVDKTIKIYHKHGGTTLTLENDFKIFYLEKNKIKFYKYYYKNLIFLLIVKLIKTFLVKTIKEKKIKTVYIKALIEGILK